MHARFCKSQRFEAEAIRGAHGTLALPRRPDVREEGRPSRFALSEARPVQLHHRQMTLPGRAAFQRGNSQLVRELSRYRVTVRVSGEALLEGGGNLCLRAPTLKVAHAHRSRKAHEGQHTTNWRCAAERVAQSRHRANAALARVPLVGQFPASHFSGATRFREATRTVGRLGCFRRGSGKRDRG